MAEGTRRDLWAVALFMMRQSDPFDGLLTKHQADEMVRRGFKVARIPIERKS